MKLFFLVGLFLIPFFSTVARSNEFQTYQVKYLSYAARDCATITSQIKTKFESATNKTVAASSCSETPDVGISISLTYQNPTVLDFNSAVFGIFWSKGSPSMLSAPMWGLYDALVDCYVDISDRVEDYEQQTGLSAIAAYCQKGSMGKYFLQVDGFGKAKKYFFEAHLNFLGNSDKNLVQDVANYLSSKGATINYQVPWGPNILIGYYGAELIYPRIVNLGISSVSLKRECEFEIANLKNTFQAQQVGDIFGARCLADTSLDPSLYYFNVGLPDNDKLKSFWMSRDFQFASFSECLQQKANSIVAYKNATSRNVWGAVCHRVNEFDSGYTLTFYGI